MALGYLRQHQRWSRFLLVFVILGFVAFYIPAFYDAEAGGPSEELGRVDGKTITVGEFEKLYSRQRRQLEEMYRGRPVDSAMLKAFGIPDRVFDGLVEQRLVAAEARRLGIDVDPAAMAKAVSELPFFQENGRFVGGAEVRRRLERQGQRLDEFEAALRQELLRQRLEGLITDGVTVSKEEVEEEYRRRKEKIRAEYVFVDATPLEAPAAVTDGDLQARFEGNKEAYRIPEKRVLSFVLIDREALKKEVTVTDSEIESHFRSHAAEFRTEEQVCAHHILLNVKQTPDAKEGRTDADAKRVAEELVAKLRAGGDFEATARKMSDDTGTATRGGDLGCFGRGEMVPAFDNAAFSAEIGAITDPVKSPYGYHVIRVDKREDAKEPALSEVSDRIRTQLSETRSRARAEEKAQSFATALTKAGKLETAAASAGLELQATAPISREETPDPLMSPTAITEAFRLKADEASLQAYPVPRGFVFVAVKEIQPSKLPTLEEVKDQLRRDVVRGKAREEAKKKAEALRSRAETEGLQKAASGLGLTRKETPQLVGRGQPLGDVAPSAALDKTVFAMPQGSLGVVAAGHGYAVLRVLEKTPFDPVEFEKERAGVAEALRQEKRQRLFEAFLDQARQRAAIVKRTDRLNRVVG